MKYKLSIIVITMNRAEQLANALISCFNCTLPDETEFVIVDNASTDNTEEIVQELFSKHGFPYKYIKEEENRGVGGGRNIGFENAEGEYCYFLDDDAIIAPECHETFFTLPIAHFEKDGNISSITTRIYDEAWKEDRDVVYSKMKNTELPTIFMYLGGSHFLRKEYYPTPLYIDIKYAFEELIPSIYAIEEGHYNCYIDSVRIIHQPQVNKWVKGSDTYFDIASKGDANILASKYLIYPVIMHPLLYMMFALRLFKHFGTKFNWHKLTYRRFKETKGCKAPRKVKCSTVFKVIKRFGMNNAF